jgi:hypothetical protein
LQRESLLEDTKKDSCSHETTEVLYKSSASHDDTPAESECSQVHGRTLKLLEEDVAGDFEENVGNED